MEDNYITIDGYQIPKCKIVNGKYFPYTAEDQQKILNSLKKADARILEEKKQKLEKIKALQDAGIQDCLIAEILPYSKEYLYDPAYLQAKEQERLQKLELEAQEQAQKQAEKNKSLQAKIKILKKKGFDEETIKIILPESEAFFNVGTAKQRVGLVV